MDNVNEIKTRIESLKSKIRRLKTKLADFEKKEKNLSDKKAKSGLSLLEEADLATLHIDIPLTKIKLSSFENSLNTLEKDLKQAQNQPQPN